MAKPAKKKPRDNQDFLYGKNYPSKERPKPHNVCEEEAATKFKKPKENPPESQSNTFRKMHEKIPPLNNRKDEEEVIDPDEIEEESQHSIKKFLSSGAGWLFCAFWPKNTAHISLYIIMFLVVASSLIIATRDNKSSSATVVIPKSAKYFVQTLGGVKFSETEGKDLVTGALFESLTEEAKAGVQAGKIPPVPNTFFDPETGRNNFWYSNRKKELVFSHLPGFDPVTGLAMRPVDATQAQEIEPGAMKLISISPRVEKGPRESTKISDLTDHTTGKVVVKSKLDGGIEVNVSGVNAINFNGPVNNLNYNREVDTVNINLEDS